MKHRLFKFIPYFLLFSLFIFLCVLLFPRNYDVPKMEPRASTKFWNLPTGSHIGYTHIEAKGKKKASPILFLQGGPGGPITDRTIEMLAPLAENGYDIYCYDQIGCGNSARLDDIGEYSATRHRRDLEAIVQQIGAEKVILIGQSWGAMLAILFVAENPARLEKLILTGPGPIYPIRRELAGLASPDSLHLKIPPYSNRIANESVNNWRVKAMNFMANNFDKKLASDDEADAFQARLVGQLNKAVVCDTSRALKAAGGNGFYVATKTMQSLETQPDPRPKLAHSQIPLFLMRGQCDNQKWGYLTDYFELFERHRLVVIPGAGHSISIEQPCLYLKALREFLAE